MLSAGVHLYDAQEGKVWGNMPVHVCACLHSSCKFMWVEKINSNKCFGVVFFFNSLPQISQGLLLTVRLPDSLPSVMAVLDTEADKGEKKHQEKE